MTDTATPTAGRELDRQIAEMVMGWQRAKESRMTFDGAVAPPQDAWLCPTPLGWRVDWNDDAIPRYSTDIAAAWTVYLTMMDKLFRQRQAFYAALQDEASHNLPRGERVAWPDVLTVLRKDFPAAICRAALATDGIL